MTVRPSTIGEVLNRLRDEFDDVTISMIRHLEAEGLIRPDRTESGYRKFTEQDVERLRHILRAQQERSLPLSVIRQELARIDAGEQAVEQATLDVDGTAAGDTGPAGSDMDLPAPPTSPPTDPLDLDLPDVRLSGSELADTVGLSEAEVAALDDHGLIDGDGTYDGADLRVARIAARLLEAGLEPRHLRMYRQAVDREVALIAQLVSPLLRQRNPDSRGLAQASAEQLTEHGEDLRRVLLAGALEELFGSRR
ncbi:MAG: MerR family transcriptional regulator [Nitriliruptoraceae bacterium]